MLVVSFDDRPVLPDFIRKFIKNTINYCDINVITPDKNLSKDRDLRKSQSEFDFVIHNPLALPGYLHAKAAFDRVFANYSTNPPSLVQSYFHRWFALNALTNSLLSDEYICLLDSDFLVGMSPADVLSKCSSGTKNHDIQLVAEWEGTSPIVIGPEFTVLTKSTLYNFCEYLLTTYYSPEMRNNLMRAYFGQIGRGMEGGICDMRALGSFTRERLQNAINLNQLGSPAIIRNFSAFLESGVGKSDNWTLTISPDKQTLQIDDICQELIGTHFQGYAKDYINLAVPSSGGVATLTRRLCDKQRLEFEIKSKRSRTFGRRIVNRAKREYIRLARTCTTFTGS